MTLLGKRRARRSRGRSGSVESPFFTFAKVIDDITHHGIEKKLYRSSKKAPDIRDVVLMCSLQLYFMDPAVKLSVSYDFSV